MKVLRRDVQRACAQVEVMVDTDGAGTFAAVERELWTALLRLAGCAIALFLARQAHVLDAWIISARAWTTYSTGGRPARSEIGARFARPSPKERRLSPVLRMDGQGKARAAPSASRSRILATPNSGRTGPRMPKPGPRPARPAVSQSLGWLSSFSLIEFLRKS
jgi:hypothetical protein